MYSVYIRGTRMLETQMKKLTETEGTKVPLATVVLTFKENILPKSINFYFNKKDITPYLSPVIMCKNCLRYGHSSSTSRDKYYNRNNYYIFFVLFEVLLLNGKVWVSKNI